jgi:hypothetical protein
MVHQAPAAGESTVGTISVSDVRGARFDTILFDATTPRWATLPNELSTSDKDRDSEGVESSVTYSEAAEVDELAEDVDQKL